MDERRTIAMNLWDHLNDQAKDIALDFLRAGVRFTKSGDQRDLDPAQLTRGYVTRGYAAHGTRGVVFDGDRVAERTTGEAAKAEMMKVIDDGDILLVVVRIPTGELAVQVFTPPTPEFCQGLIELIRRLPAASVAAETGAGPQ